MKGSVLQLEPTSIAFKDIKEGMVFRVIKSFTGNPDQYVGECYVVSPHRFKTHGFESSKFELTAMEHLGYLSCEERYMECFEYVGK